MSTRDGASRAGNDLPSGPVSADVPAARRTAPSRSISQARVGGPRLDARRRQVRVTTEREGDLLAGARPSLLSRGRRAVGLAFNALRSFGEQAMR